MTVAEIGIRAQLRGIFTRTILCSIDELNWLAVSIQNMHVNFEISSEFSDRSTAKRIRKSK